MYSLVVDTIGFSTSTTSSSIALFFLVFLVVLSIAFNLSLVINWYFRAFNLRLVAELGISLPGLDSRTDAEEVEFTNGGKCCFR